MLHRLASAESSAEGITILGYDHTGPEGIQSQSPEMQGAARWSGASSVQD
jgi:hypothetical protein